MNQKTESARCDNCGAIWPVDALDFIENLSERIYPGEEVPAGQCPDCQACAFLIDEQGRPQPRGERQHWMISVRDSINDYREVQGGYFDGTKAEAAQQFRHNTPWSRYFGNDRYQIVMRTNPEILQEPGEPAERTLYEDCKAAGLEIDSHESDLYIRDSSVARRLLEIHDKRGKRVYQVDGWNVSVFRSQIDNAAWLDVPFAFDPYWQKKAATS